jgi:hypothetical protein
VVPFVKPWSPINCRHQEINIKTGQARYSRHLWYVKVSERVEDTILSKVLGGESVDVADIAPWHTVNTFSPGLHYSPHYRFHAALFQASEIGLLFETLEPDAERKKQIVRNILTLWQTHGDYFEASRYIATLSEEASKILEQKYPGIFPKPNTSSSSEVPVSTP